MPLNEKQKRFALEYIVDLNATQAAKRAGYSEKTSYSQGQRLLKNDEIQKRIEKLNAKRNKRTEISGDWVLGQLKKVADRCMQEEAVCDEDGNPVGEYKFEHSGANKALELLGRHNKLFTDKIEQTNETVVRVKDYTKGGVSDK
ncbi:MAG: terminase small subunit [Anderseniella sp.]|nr:terminase small subunit [Anderseniella sp.]